MDLIISSLLYETDWGYIILGCVILTLMLIEIFSNKPKI